MRAILDFLLALFGHRRHQPQMRSLGVPHQEFVVIGLGRFGSSVAQTLVARGHTVLGVDRDPVLVQQLADEITQTVALDSTDEDALRELDIGSYDTAVVAIGTNLEANLLTTVALKSMGVRNVICKAATLRQREILLKVGADRVVLPEQEGGNRLAQAISTPGILDSIDLGGDKRVSELRVPRRCVQQTIRQSGLDRRHGLWVAAVVRNNELTVCPDGDYLLTDDDLLIVIGDDSEIVSVLVQ